MKHPETAPLTNRRQMLLQSGGGFACLALSHLLARDSAASGAATGQSPQGFPIAHHPARVQRVIQLFMTGGVSPMDTFDYKPELERLHGQMLGPKEKPEGFTAPAGAIMKSPFAFAQHGQSGRWVSSVFPEQAKLVDEMAFLMAMTTKTNVHGPGTYMMNSGFLLPGFPCLGAWISYALGNLTDDLPTFVVLPDCAVCPTTRRAVSVRAFCLRSTREWSSTRLRSSRFRILFRIPSFHLLAMRRIAKVLSCCARSTRSMPRRTQAIPAWTLGSPVTNWPPRCSCQRPRRLTLAGESGQVHASYGLDAPATEDFGRRCLLARRLIERGVRFVQVWSGPQGAVNNWDNHSNIQTELPPMAASVDRPIAALLRDLKARGLDRDTLVIWTTEFGRTPFAQGSVGRDHNGGSFVTWLWGAGIRQGVAYGRSDDWGYQAVENKTWCYDLHATILHLLGIDHKRLTVRQNGIDRRLTDVHGQVIHEILA